MLRLLKYVGSTVGYKSQALNKWEGKKKELFFFFFFNEEDRKQADYALTISMPQI